MIPNLSGVLRGWTEEVNVQRVTRTVVDHLEVQTPTNITLHLLMQPLTPERLRRKPEEQRSWKWYSFITYADDTELAMDDRIQIEGVWYRIDSRTPWDRAGFRKYEGYEDWQGSSLDG